MGFHVGSCTDPCADFRLQATYVMLATIIGQRQPCFTSVKYPERGLMCDSRTLFTTWPCVLEQGPHLSEPQVPSVKEIGQACRVGSVRVWSQADLGSKELPSLCLLRDLGQVTETH